LEKSNPDIQLIPPDPKDVRSLRRFFQIHEWLQSSEIAELLGCSQWTVNKYRRRCGMARPRLKIFTYRPQYHHFPLATNWDNPEWFRQKYEVEGWGKLLIARMIGRRSKFVLDRLRRYGIPLRKHGSKNPCCTRPWLEEHYEVLRESIPKCARLAGVNNYAIIQWLVKFGFNIRSLDETEHSSHR
jgi:hypothetical protein